MSKSVFLILFTTFYYSGLMFSQSLTSNCDLPSILYFTFDSSNVRQGKEIIGDFNINYNIDSTNHNRYLHKLFNQKINLLCQSDENTNFIQFNNNSTEIFIFYYDDFRIQEISITDSCTVTKIIYDRNGSINALFKCDYLKPDDCYRKYYSDGILSYEEKLLPFLFYEGDPKEFNIYSQTDKAIIVNVIYYDISGEIIGERKINPESLKNKK